MHAEANPGATGLPPCRRSHRRVSAWGRIARLEAVGDTGLCRVHNLSDGGMLLETAIELCVGDPVMIALDCTNSLQGRVAWMRRALAGIRFLHAIDSSKFIRKLIEDRLSASARPPRLPVHSAAIATTALGSFPTMVGNISQKGMMICHRGDLLAGADIEITLEHGLAARGTVRWSDGFFAGVEFSGMIEPGQLESARRLQTTADQRHERPGAIEDGARQGDSPLRGTVRR